MLTTKQMFAAPHIDNIAFKKRYGEAYATSGKEAPDWTLTELQAHFENLPIYVQNVAFQWGLGSEEFLAMVGYHVRDVITKTKAANV